MTELSPAATAVLNAYMDNCGWLDGPLEEDHSCAAAVLRAAADQVVPETELPMNAQGSLHWHRTIRQAEIRSELLAIAAELEALSE